MRKITQEKLLASTLLIVWVFLAVTFTYVFPITEFYGFSMMPTYPETSTIILSPFLPKNLTGMVVVVRFPPFHLSVFTENGTILNGTTYVAHRVRWDNGTTIETQGDANPSPDPFSRRSAVMGVVIFESPSYGLFYVYKIGWGLLSIIDMILVVDVYRRCRR